MYLIKEKCNYVKENENPARVNQDAGNVPLIDPVCLRGAIPNVRNWVTLK